MELVRYDAMCRAIADAYEVDEVKDIRDKSAALEHYARQAHNVEAERRCCEIRLRAERKWGQLYSAGQKAKGASEPGTNRGTTPSPGTRTSTLDDMHVSYDQSSQWQRLGALSDEEFEAGLSGSDKPTANSILNKHATPVSDHALWLWGRLRDFQRHHILSSNPEAVMSTMTPEMRTDVIELAPQVADWLFHLTEQMEGRDVG